MAAEHYTNGYPASLMTPQDYSSYTAMVMAASTGDHTMYATDGSYWAATGTYGNTYLGGVGGASGPGTTAADYSHLYGANGSFTRNSSGSFYSNPTSAPSSPCFAAAPQVPVKRYTHDPYASTPSTPTSTPIASGASSAFNTSADSTTGHLPPAMSLAAPMMGPTSSMTLPMVATTSTSSVAAASFAPVYAPEGSYSDAVSYPVAHTTAEQFAAVIGNVANTACTPKGRHLLMAVLRLQHLDKIQTIFDEILPRFQELSVNQHGCHVVRTLVECITEDQLASLVATLSAEQVVELATSSQSTRRILQVMFERHRSESLDFVVNVVSRQCLGISCTQQGCIAVMRILENALPHQQRGLLEHLAPHLSVLAMDAYGNYVVQSIVQNTDAAVSSSILGHAFEGRWVQLARNKFASNVLEKLLRVAALDTRVRILNALVFNRKGLEETMGDGFGNFVLQAIIETSVDPEEFRRIAELVRMLLPNSPYGHKIEAKLKSKRMMA